MDKWDERKKEAGFNDVANNQAAIRILLGGSPEDNLVVKNDSARGDPLPTLNAADNKEMIYDACSYGRLSIETELNARYRRGCARRPHLYARFTDAPEECHKMFTERLGAAEVPQCKDGFVPFCIPSIIKSLTGKGHLTESDSSNAENGIEYTNSTSATLPSGQTISDARTSPNRHMPDTDVAFQNENELPPPIDLSDMERALQDDTLFLGWSDMDIALQNSDFYL
ncbi:hypothetical protein PABG_07455 [Paracoccidioides brasiliensis Pb03]|nr:hypothetical protein PABG_07455 [Paracoccidioides brasiliensis Pb03]